MVKLTEVEPEFLSSPFFSAIIADIREITSKIIIIRFSLLFRHISEYAYPTYSLIKRLDIFVYGPGGILFVQTV